MEPNVTKVRVDACVTIVWVEPYATIVRVDACVTIVWVEPYATIVREAIYNHSKVSGVIYNYIKGRWRHM